MLPGKPGESLERHVLIGEPGHSELFGDRSHLESAGGKAGFGLLICGVPGCQSDHGGQPLGRHALHLSLQPACEAQGIILKPALVCLFVCFLKAIGLKWPLQLQLCSDT